MQKIGSKADCEKLWGLPPPVYQRIEETVALLNYHYGENRNIDKDLGGYVLVIEDNQDFDEFKKTFSKEVSNITVEYSDIIFWEDKPSHTASLFLVSSDFSILLIIPYSLTPTAFSATINEIKRYKMDKCVDNVFCSAKNIVVKSPCEVVLLDEKNIELLNSVYKDINDEFGIDVAMRMYQLYKGTQVNFSMRFLNPELVKRKILEEFDGTNLKQLAVKYSYSEKTLRRLIKESVEQGGIS